MTYSASLVLSSWVNIYHSWNVNQYASSQVHLYHSLWKQAKVNKVVCIRTVKAYRGWRGTVAIILNLSARWRWIVGHFTVSKITPSIHWIRRMGRPQSHTGGLGEERVFCPCLGSNHRLSSHYIDYTILTPYFYIKTNKLKHILCYVRYQIYGALRCHDIY